MTVLLALLITAQVPLGENGARVSSSGVVINEFMSLPLSSTTEADGEWVELFNNTDEWINLSGWKLSSGYGQEVVLATYLLPPHGYFVLAGCTDSARNGGLDANQVLGDCRIHESGSLTLKDNYDRTMDHIDYNASWPVTPGVSCEKMNPGWVSCSSSSWNLSTSVYGRGDKGTPGNQNSIYQNSFAQNSWAFIKAFVQ